jgi:hypothetical protein
VPSQLAKKIIIIIASSRRKKPRRDQKARRYAVNDLQFAVDVRYRLHIFPLPHRGHVFNVLLATAEEA